jgi:hypothetical protein
MGGRAIAQREDLRKSFSINMVHGEGIEPTNDCNPGRFLPDGSQQHLKAFRRSHLSQETGKIRDSFYLE